MRAMKIYYDYSLSIQPSIHFLIYQTFLFNIIRSNVQLNKFKKKLKSKSSIMSSVRAEWEILIENF